MRHLDAAVPADRACVRPSDRARRIADGCTLGHTPDVKNLIEDLAGFKPTFVLSVPRVFEKVYNTAKQRRTPAARARSSISPSRSRSAIRRARAGHISPSLKLQHALFDQLVYVKLRAALVATASRPCRVARRWAIGSDTSSGRRRDDLRGLRPHRDVRGHLRQPPDALKIGTVGRPVGGSSARIADDGELLLRGGDGVSRLLAQRRGDRGGDRRRRLVPHRRHRRDRRRRLRPDHRPQEGDHRHRGRQERRAGRARGPRARALAGGQCLVVGDRQPFIAALVTIDPEAFPQWLASVGRPADTGWPT